MLPVFSFFLFAAWRSQLLCCCYHYLYWALLPHTHTERNKFTPVLSELFKCIVGTRRKSQTTIKQGGLSESGRAEM